MIFLSFFHFAWPSWFPILVVTPFACDAMRSGHFVKWSTPSIGFLKDRPRIRLGLLSDEAVLGCVSSRVVSRNLPDASSRTHLFVYPEGYTGARLQCIKPCKVSLAFRKRPHNMRASLGSSMMHKAELSNDKQKIGNSQPNSWIIWGPMTRPVERDSGCVKSCKMGMSTMTSFSCPVAVQMVAGSYFLRLTHDTA